MYMLFVAFGFVASCLLTIPVLADKIHDIPGVQTACEAANLDCNAASLVYRVGLVGTVFFLTHYIFACIGHLYHGWFTVRWVVYLGLTVASLWLPAIGFEIYAYIALVTAGLYLLVMLVMAIDFVHHWQDSWVGHDSVWAFRGIVGFSLSFTAITVTVVVLEFVWFSCDLTRIFTSINLVLAVILYFLPFKFNRATLLPISAVALYSTYLVYGGLSSGYRTSQACYHWASNANSFGTMEYINMVLLFISLVYTTFSMANDSNLFDIGHSSTHEDASSIPDYHHINDNDDGDNQDIGRENQRYRHLFFILGLACCYTCAVVSSWHVYGDNISHSLDSGTASMYIKLGCSWMCYLLFGWSVIAPSLFPDRDWEGGMLSRSA